MRWVCSRVRSLSVFSFSIWLISFFFLYFVVFVSVNRHQAKMKSYEQSIEEKSRDLIEIQSQKQLQNNIMVEMSGKTVHIHANPRKQRQMCLCCFECEYILCSDRVCAPDFHFFISFFFPCAHFETSFYFQINTQSIKCERGEQRLACGWLKRIQVARLFIATHFQLKKLLGLDRVGVTKTLNSAFIYAYVCLCWINVCDNAILSRVQRNGHFDIPCDWWHQIARNDRFIDDLTCVMSGNLWATENLAPNKTTSETNSFATRVTLFGFDGLAKFDCVFIYFGHINTRNGYALSHTQTHRTFSRKWFRV